MLSWCSSGSPPLLANKYCCCLGEVRRKKSNGQVEKGRGGENGKGKGWEGGKKERVRESGKGGKGLNYFSQVYYAMQ